MVRHEGQERVVDFGTPDRNPLHTQFTAFYADCEHEVRPMQARHRLCLVYNLTLARSKKAIRALGHSSRHPAPCKITTRAASRSVAEGTWSC